MEQEAWEHKACQVADNWYSQECHVPAKPSPNTVISSAMQSTKYEVTQFDNRAIEHYNALSVASLVTTWYQSHLTLGAEKAKGLPELFIFSNPGSIPIVSEVKQNDHLDQKKQAWPKPWSTTCMPKFCQLWKQHSEHNLTPHIVQAWRSTE
jgi:hypothetical protein